jgi:hypothetical protein
LGVMVPVKHKRWRVPQRFGPHISGATPILFLV